MQGEREYRGSCFCGAVQLRVVGKPAAVGFCHCTSCRHWSGGPVNAASLWQPAAVIVTRGSELIGSYAKTERSVRKWCTRCGGALPTDHPKVGLVNVPVALLENFPFEPQVHLHYSEHVLPMRDGLPKMADIPAEIGGSGKVLTE